MPGSPEAEQPDDAVKLAANESMSAPEGAAVERFARELEAEVEADIESIAEKSERFAATQPEGSAEREAAERAAGEAKKTMRGLGDRIKGFFQGLNESRIEKRDARRMATQLEKLQHRATAAKDRPERERVIADLAVSHREYQHAKKLDPEKWKRIEWALNRVADRLMSDALEAGDTQTALRAWPIFSKAHWGTESTARQLSEAAEREAPGDGAKLRDRLQGTPDIYLKHLLDREPGNGQEILRAIESLVDHPDRAWILKEVSVGRHVPSRGLSERGRKALFETYAETRNFASISGALDVFQEDVRRTSGAERERVLGELSAHNLWQLLSYIKVTPQEYRMCLAKSYDGEAWTAPEKRQELLAFLKEQRPLALLTNREVLAYEEDPSELVDALAEPITISYSSHDLFLNRVKMFQQVLTRGQEYPGLQAQRTRDALGSFLEKNSHVNARRFIEGVTLLRSSGVLSAEEFAEHAGRYVDRAAIVNLTDLLEFRDEALGGGLRQIVEDSLVKRAERYELSDLVGRIAADSLPFDRAKFDMLLARYLDDPQANIETRFQMYFVQRPFLDDATYAPRFIAKVSDFRSFVAILASGRDRGELTQERYLNFLRMCADTGSADAIAVLRRQEEVQSSPELMSAVMDGLIRHASFNDVLSLLQRRELEPLSESDLVKARDRLAATVPVPQMENYFDVLRPHFLEESVPKIVDVLIAQGNHGAVAGIVLFDARRNFHYLEKEERSYAIDAVWRSGDAEAISDLVAIAVTAEAEDGRYPYVRMTPEEARGGVEALFRQDAPKALLAILENAAALGVSPAQIDQAAAKILQGGSAEAKDTLLLMHLRAKAGNSFMNAISYNARYGPSIRLGQDAEALLFGVVAREGSTSSLALMLDREVAAGIPSEAAEAAFDNFLRNASSTELLQVLKESVGRGEGVLGQPDRRAALVDAITLRPDARGELYQEYIVHKRVGEEGFSLSQEQLDRLAAKVVQGQRANEATLILAAEQSHREVNGRTVGLRKEDELALAKLIIRFGMEQRFLYEYDRGLFQEALLEELKESKSELTLMGIFHSQLDLEFNAETLQALSRFSAEVLTHGDSANSLRLFDAITRANPDRVRKIIDVTVLKDVVLDICRKQGIRMQALEMTGRLAALGALNAEEVREAYALAAEDSVERQQQLAVAKIFGNVVRGASFELLNELGEPGQEVGEKVRVFAEKYGTLSGKGRTLLALIAANEYQAGMAMKELLGRVAVRAEGYSKILDRMPADRIPPGLRVSIGIEYEMTHSLGPAYELASNGGNFKWDIVALSEAADIGHGNDSLHEIAPRPADNPYSLLLELHLVQQMGFMNLNFDQEEYAHAGHGYHLTLGGEKGLGVTEQTNFLQNSLILAGWGGVNAGARVDKAAFGYSIRDKFSTKNVAVFDNVRPAVELRALSVDRWEQFERAVTTSFYAAVAIQAVERHTKLQSAAIQRMENIPSSPNEFMSLLESNGLLRGEAPDAKAAAMIHEWARLQKGMLEIIEDHNANFYVNETAGYLDAKGEWVDSSEFRGEYNKARFEEVVRSLPGGMTAEEYASTLRFEPRDLFTEVDASFVNTCVGINNLYLKNIRLKASEGSQGEKDTEFRGDKANAAAMLDVTKRGRQIEESKWGAVTSVFESGGRTREGYYALQGGSDRMVMHATQAKLLEFRSRMEALIQE